MTETEMRDHIETRILEKNYANSKGKKQSLDRGAFANKLLTDGVYIVADAITTEVNVQRRGRKSKILLIIEDLFPVFALYRECKTNPSAYYKFLCLYKIMEGIYKNIRPSLMKKAKKMGKTIKCEKEVVPNHFLIREYNEKFVNMKIRKLFDDVLTKEFRHAVAHFSINDGSLLNLTDYNTNRKFANVLFITEFCCRILIDNHSKMYFQLYPQISK